MGGGSSQHEEGGTYGERVREAANGKDGSEVARWKRRKLGREGRRRHGGFWERGTCPGRRGSRKRVPGATQGLQSPFRPMPRPKRDSFSSGVTRKPEARNPFF